jgi:hypothetical protein
MNLEGVYNQAVATGSFCRLQLASLSRRQSPKEPGFRQGPFALHRGWRYSERCRRFVDREPREKSQFHDPALPRVDRGQRFERFVECQHVHARRPGDGQRFVQTEHRHTASPLVGALPASVIDEDLTHQGGRYAEEVRPARERHAIDIDESKVDLVNERGRLEPVARRLALKAAARHPAQFVVDERDQAVERGGVSLAPGQEQARYIVHAERSIISS